MSALGLQQRRRQVGPHTAKLGADRRRSRISARLINSSRAGIVSSMRPLLHHANIARERRARHCHVQLTGFRSVPSLHFPIPSAWHLNPPPSRYDLFAGKSINRLNGSRDICARRELRVRAPRTGRDRKFAPIHSKPECFGVSIVLMSGMQTFNFSSATDVS